MLGRSLLTLVRRSAYRPAIHATKRNFAQVGLAISTPPRCQCSYGEKILHALFIFTVWLSPMAYFLTQIKVWRREYIE